MTSIRIAAIVIAAALVGSSAAAQDKAGINLEEGATGTSVGVADYIMAQTLFEMGVARKDALLIVAAAKISSGLQLTDVDREKDARSTAGATDDAATGSHPDTATMIAAAKDLAGGDEGLLILAEEVEAAGPANRTGGASRTLADVGAGGTDVWKIPFYGGSYAELGLSSSGDAQLDVIVTDENGNRVWCPSSAHHQFYCDFVPKWNGYFFVSVANHGAKGTGYVLLTN